VRPEATAHRIQPHRGDRKGASRGKQSDDDRVGAAGLVVVADRVGERRPGELEAADEDVHPLAELDRERVETRLGQPGGADEDDPVDEVERVEGELRGHSRQAEPHQPAEQALPASEPAALVQHPDHEHGTGPEGAEQDAARLLALDDDQPDRERNRHQDVGTVMPK
jgi:hypothetical protein